MDTNVYAVVYVNMCNCEVTPIGIYRLLEQAKSAIAMDWDLGRCNIDEWERENIPDEVAFGRTVTRLYTPSNEIGSGGYYMIFERDICS